MYPANKPRGVKSSVEMCYSMRKHRFFLQFEKSQVIVEKIPAKHICLLDKLEVIICRF